MHGFSQSALGQSGYPSASLIAPDGKVVWVGHPSSVNEELIQEHIANASTEPVGIDAIAATWPDSARGVASAVAKRNYVKAHAVAVKVGDEKVLAYVDRVMARQVGKLRGMHDAGDFLGFVNGMKSAKKMLAPEAGTELAALLAVVNIRTRSSARRSTRCSNNSRS